MKIQLTTLAFAALLAATCAQQASGQTKQQGNVVEYFGKEKIETTSEGEVFHKFKDGMLLPTANGGGTLFTGHDMVEWLYASGNFRRPVAGEKIEWSYPEPPPASDSEIDPQRAQQMANAMRRRGFTPLTPWTWSAIEVDSTGVFNSPSMRSAFLYTEYNSPKEQIVLLDATGGTRTYINGMPHEGDHYDFGYTLVPVKLRKGINEIIYTPGRFGRVNSKLVHPTKNVMFTKRDMTMPDIIIGENDEKWGAIRVMNVTEKELSGMTVETILESGEKAEYKVDQIMPMALRKLKFRIPALKSTPTDGKVKATVILSDAKGKELDRTQIELRAVPATVHHERTFVSRVDGSVQYYSVAPATGEGDKGLVLSVHGASVEARNQARAYKQKDWAHIVAATNRRPFGFNWEEWGRIDALEVLEDAKRVFKTAPEKTYLTGHSMGGHGTWYLGTTYPDKFAAIAPCASYPDIAGYGSGRGDRQHRGNEAFDAIERAANGGRVVSMIRNLAQSGVYILHGDADEVVPISQVRPMRELLGTFHPNFCYYEYPGGSHWYGDHSVDWNPIFEFFKRQHIPANKEVSDINFTTATPAISAKDYWLKLEQQESPYNFTNIKVSNNKGIIKVDAAENVTLFTLDIPSLELSNPEAVITVGDKSFQVKSDSKATFSFADGAWSVVPQVDKSRKYAERNGGFKQAFDNNVLFVYATGGTAAENQWYQNKARFDAETFYYRGNGSIDVIADRDFTPEAYKDRNVVIYGNSSNNSAWNKLLAASPLQVGRGELKFRDQVHKGDNLATYFIYPRPDSETASVGVVAATGEKGMRATGANNYISGITGFPDIMIFNTDMRRDGLKAVLHAGFFDNDWK